MKAKVKFTDKLWHDVSASLKDGQQDYTAVTDENGKLLAWGLQYQAAKGQWLWVHKNFR